MKRRTILGLGGFIDVVQNCVGTAWTHCSTLIVIKKRMHSRINKEAFNVFLMSIPRLDPILVFHSVEIHWVRKTHLKSHMFQYVSICLVYMTNSSRCPSLI